MKLAPIISRFLLLAVLAVRPVAAESLATSAGPLGCAAPEYFFGWADNRTRVDHVFVLENRTNQALTVRIMDPDPAPTVARELVLAPDSRAQVNLGFSPRGLKGEVTKDFAVELPDFPGQALTLRFRGEARQALQLEPERVAFGTIPVDAAVTQSVVLTFNTSWPLKLHEAQSSSAAVRAAAGPNESGPGYRIAVSTVPPLPVGALSGTVRVLTDDPMQRDLEIPVSAAVELPLRVEPRELVVPADGVITGELRVVVQSPFRAFAVQEAIAPPSLETSISGEGPAAYAITLRPVPGAVVSGDAYLRIRTDVAAQSDLLVPFRRAE
ncbi:MAG TPA: hypothetical protein P5567_09050 [Kiritimatiellia bacterium]|nr:hypothetical protein [Kiritimatiellia bacterium]HRZ12588.1 hypothetical protein [Kiritimatiellia bacterium]HSA17666.1 hypothetical protein [Kiritimatiellia bacterium]